ncbi:glycosyltransferase family 4 protein [Paenibacillus hexagrammi]|uniref:Glycosyltransferase family 4 protein n=1 Tax=Paenibacillus hexagrammi TaxID=2908839 RepID=A0ABY3SKK3_9BACL|nr:glycosyltransferase family 4 protein [Paenibacillus sp. YPD9-1]UJF34582.1 glycosyltransferase family 4 protein [Paenibacillus sp. YPD9-1]
MKVLHICSYYIGNKLYMNLVEQLSLLELSQDVFIPIRSVDEIGKNQLSLEFNTVNYVYRNIIKRHHKLLFLNKINKQKSEIEQSILLDNIDIIHAHTVFSDGGTAYQLNKKFGTEYIINVRNTDLNIFYKYGIHLRGFMYKVLLKAKAVIFISHAYKQKMFSRLPSKIIEKIEKKSYVIPNGIDDEWHEYAPVMKEKNSSISKKLTLLFIGLLDKNKNLGAVIKSCAKLREEGYNVNLHVVGNGPMEKRYITLCERLKLDSNTVIFHGYESDKKKIINIMDESDIFVMPSYKETFGIVYIEAMSRGLPLIYTKNEGIDGFFNNGEVGLPVDPFDINEIVESIKKIAYKNDEQLSNNCILNAKRFNWRSIANEYLEIYKNQVN